MSERESDEITLIPSNLQLFLVCLGLLALLGIFFALGYSAGKSNPRTKPAEAAHSDPGQKF
jgi:hypothetical protein